MLLHLRASIYPEIQGSSNARAGMIRHPGSHADRNDSAPGVHALVVRDLVPVPAPDGLPTL
jgi:hypothetical protein